MHLPEGFSNGVVVHKHVCVYAYAARVRVHAQVRPLNASAHLYAGDLFDHLREAGHSAFRLSSMLSACGHARIFNSRIQMQRDLYLTLYNVQTAKHGWII